MQKSKRTILSTRPLDEPLIQLAAERNIHIDCISFIDTTPVVDKELSKKIQQLSQQNITAVFTSMNAVEAVKSHLHSSTNWEVFCMGNTTKKLAGEIFGTTSIAATANDAGALADSIIAQNKKEVYFFCGDQRREELPSKLQANNMVVHEITVYHTTATQQTVSKTYDGILFFSPSAVNSFFSFNKINANTILFAIGSTTANTLKQFSNNTVIKADSPGKEILVKRMMDYFSPIYKTDETT